MKKLVALLALIPIAAAAQDIRGLEACMAEKNIERRTGCLQANVELLQQTLTRQMRDSAARLATANADIAALRAEVTKLKADMALLKAKVEPAKPDAAKKP